MDMSLQESPVAANAYDLLALREYYETRFNKLEQLFNVINSKLSGSRIVMSSVAEELGEVRLSFSDVATMLNCSETSIHNYCNQNLLFKHGKRKNAYFLKSEVDKAFPNGLKPNKVKARYQHG